MKTFVLLLIPLLASLRAFSAPADNKSFSYLSLCEKRNQPVFVYQTLWTDSAQPGPRLHEFWLDRNRDSLQAQWWVKDEKPLYMIGSILSETEFFLCAYRSGQTQAFGVFLGVFEGSSLKLKAAS